ncbi:MAG: cell division protein ZapA [Bacteroidota bacterium]|nr:cell division protein ZapA [Bacteroidota bacterium]
MEEKLSIRVNIADRYYPLKIEREDEERIRKAAKLINDKVFQYKTKYADKDIQDFMAMAALQFVIRLIEMEEKTDESNLVERLQKLNKVLDEFLKAEESNINN